MELTSSEFKNNEHIPSKFTCEGEDVNPVLLIKDAPSGTKSLALIVDDPDAPMGTWVHWVVYDIPLIEKIEEGSVPGKQGANDFRKKDYGGAMSAIGDTQVLF